MPDCSSNPALLRAFYEQPTLLVARQLLGKTLVRHFDNGEIAAGRIVETEAYTRDDPACHAFRGKSKSNGTMFGPPGHAYIHINYGLHFCLNAVTAGEGVAEAALIRAVEPLENAARLWRNYFGEADPVSEADARRDRRLTSGPGKLTKAFAIPRAFDGMDLTDPNSPLFLAEGEPVCDDDVVTTARIGITKAADYPWRFYVRSSRFVSRR